MLPGIGPSVFQTIASGCHSFANRLRCSRETCEEFSDMAVLMGIPSVGIVGTYYTFDHFWNNDQTILAVCSIAVLGLGTIASYFRAIKARQRSFQEEPWMERIHFPPQPAIVVGTNHFTDARGG